jgi:5-methylphenazine-1-carboxylate 1-monooxygenase
MKIMIVGGGIGGLTAALCLHRIGVRATVFESSHEFRELGVGINLLPHAVKILQELGVAEQLLESGVELERYMWFNRFGQTIWSEPRGRNAGYKWPQISIHRGRLQAVLMAAVRERLGEEALIGNHHLVDFKQQDDRVTANFIDRRTGEPVGSYEADALIGADGIHSVVRSNFYPDEGAPRWSGNMLWRMTVETDPVLGGQTMIAMGNARTKIVGYEISREAKARGKSLFNWIAEVRLAEPGATVPEREDWNRESKIEEFLPSFSDWEFDWISIPELAKQTKQVWSFPMVDRDPVESWTSGRVTLLGDAAHAMWPIGSNGASQAVLDCHSLAEQLTVEADIELAFQAYDDQRRPATSAIVLANRANAHDQLLELVEERAPEGFRDIADVASNDELSEIVSQYRQTALFDKKQLQ